MTVNTFWDLLTNLEPVLPHASRVRLYVVDLSVPSGAGEAFQPDDPRGLIQQISWNRRIGKQPRIWNLVLTEYIWLKTLTLYAVSCWGTAFLFLWRLSGDDALADCVVILQVRSLNTSPCPLSSSVIAARRGTCAPLLPGGPSWPRGRGFSHHMDIYLRDVEVPIICCCENWSGIAEIIQTSKSPDLSLENIRESNKYAQD